MTNNHGANNDDTQVFGSVDGSRPRQVFPDGQQPVYQQSVQYEEPPRSYEVPAGKTGSGVVGVLSALLLLALIAAAALGFMYYSASNRQVAPVTTTVTTTAVQTTTAKVTTTEKETVTTTANSRGNAVPTAMPALPSGIQDQLHDGQDDVEDLLNNMFGGGTHGTNGADD